MKTLVAAMALIVALPAFAGSTRGYVKKNGTYVAPSHHSKANGTAADNYTSEGNTNPFTGEEGTKDPNAPRPKPKKR